MSQAFPLTFLDRDTIDALEGSSGVPSEINKYVTQDDPTLSDDRVASSLRTSTSAVDITGTSPLGAGYVLLTTGTENAVWSLLPTAPSLSSIAATTVIAGTSSSAGTSLEASRSDHIHAVSTGTPVNIGVSNSQGNSTSLARANHVHAHGNQTNGSLHAVATTSTNGFLSSADKTAYDNHVSDVTIHRTINDAVENTTNTWSSSKIMTEISEGITQLLSLNALKFRYYADQLDYPRSTDWAVNLGAPSARDTTYPAITVRRFDDTAIEGVGFSTVFPILVTDMLIRIKAKAITAPPGNRGVVWRLYWRKFPNNSAPTAWSNLTLPTMTIPTNTNLQYYSYTAPLTTWGITAGDFTQFELVRVGNNGSDTLPGDIALFSIELEYS